MPDNKTRNSDSERHPSSSELISSAPSNNTIALGEAFSELCTILEEHSETQFRSQDEHSDFQQFQKSNTYYVNPKECQAINCLEAAKQWSSRLSSIVEKVDWESTLDSEQAEIIKDRHASLRLVGLAEDFTLISAFCRKLESAQIETHLNDYGIELVFILYGQNQSFESRKLEDESFNHLLSKAMRENSLKSWINCSEDCSELRVVVLKPNARLGLSPTG